MKEAVRLKKVAPLLYGIFCIYISFSVCLSGWLLVDDVVCIAAALPTSVHGFFGLVWSSKNWQVPRGVN